MLLWLALWWADWLALEDFSYSLRRDFSEVQMQHPGCIASSAYQGLSGRPDAGFQCCEGSRHRQAPIRSRRCSGPGRPEGDTKTSGRRVTHKAPSAHVEGGSGRSEASPTATLKDTHSVEGMFSEICNQGPQS
jgi:hypothetical protein